MFGEPTTPPPDLSRLIEQLCPDEIFKAPATAPPTASAAAPSARRRPGCGSPRRPRPARVRSARRGRRSARSPSAPGCSGRPSTATSPTTRRCSRACSAHWPREPAARSRRVGADRRSRRAPARRARPALRLVRADRTMVENLYRDAPLVPAIAEPSRERSRPGPRPDLVLIVGRRARGVPRRDASGPRSVTRSSSRPGGRSPAARAAKARRRRRRFPRRAIVAHGLVGAPATRLRSPGPGSQTGKGRGLKSRCSSGRCGFESRPGHLIRCRSGKHFRPMTSSWKRNPPLLRCSQGEYARAGTWRPRPSHTPAAAACSAAGRPCSSCRATSGSSR